MFLLVRRFAGVVFMLVVAVEFQAFAHRQEESDVESGGTPFLVLAFVVRFGGDVWDEFISMDSDTLFQRQLIAVAPGENAGFPIEIGTAAIGQEKTCVHGEVSGGGRESSVFLGSSGAAR